MQYKKLKETAEILETSLLERQACKDISGFSIEAIPDDGVIKVSIQENKPIDKIKITLKIGSSCNTYPKGDDVKLFTREEKRETRLMDLYDKYISEGKRPNKAAKLAREDFRREQNN